MILLVGPPGAGKSTFCEQVILQNLAIDKPIIYVTTEYDPSKAKASLREKVPGKIEPALISFVDAYNETLGVSVSEKPDTVHADCANLSGLGIAISKLQERIGTKGVLLVFDSLVSPYLLSGPEVVRFMRLTLSKFAAEGNSVLACMDEGCGKQEDLGAMMSISDGVIKMETREGKQFLNVVKHPKLKPTIIEAPIKPERIGLEERVIINPEVGAAYIRADEAVMRREVGDFVNLFWPNFAHWSGMLWDPKRFPTLTYISSKQGESMVGEFIRLLPWYARLYLKLFMPKNFSKGKDMKKLMSWARRLLEEGDSLGVIEYLEDASKMNEHYVRGYEVATCWGFENVGATLGLGTFGAWAGAIMGFEKKERDWNWVETKCIGLGDPYCEIKIVPGEINELKTSLESLGSTIIERIHDRLIGGLMAFMLHGKPLWKKRPRLGNEISLHAFGHIIGGTPATVSERCRIAMRLGGVMAGKKFGERLMEAELGEDEAVKRVLHLLEHCKVGKVSMDDTIRMVQNCESFMMRSEGPSCYFTTGFLNGFFSAVKNQHVKETRCIAMGDPYCEWEFR
jgi:predicted hydrocarbon binding protein/KaiC/GvpD/RAD55 family RecA-like ATPase